MKIAQSTTAAILGIAVTMLNVASVIHAAPIPTGRAGVRGVLMPRGGSDAFRALVDEAGSSGIAESVNAAQLPELPQELDKALGSAVSSKLNMQEQPLQLLRHAPQPESPSLLAERPAVSDSPSTSASLSRLPEVTFPARFRFRPGKKRLDDGADEKTLKRREMNREAVRRSRMRAKVRDGIKKGQLSERALLAAPQKLRTGHKITLNTPEAELNRERVRATRTRKEAKANAESQVNTSEPISATRKVVSTSSKRRKVQSSTASPEGVRQSSLEAEHFSVPDLNLPPPEF